MARSRKELEDIIKRSEVVMLKGGGVAKTIDQLPTAVELAGNDIVKKAHAIGDLKAARAELDRQIAAADADGEAGEPKTAEELAAEFGAALSVYTVVGPDRAKALLKAGYDSRDKVLAAPDADLAKVKGFENQDDRDALRKLLMG